MLNIQDAVVKRYPKIFSRSRLLSQPAIALLKMLSHDKELAQFSRQHPDSSGSEFVEHVLAYFNFGFVVRQSEKERIPARGRVVIIANHPIGTLDALALLQLVGGVRSDVKVVDNHLLNSAPALDSLLLKVPAKHKGERGEAMQAIQQHLDNEGAIILFPAGEVSRINATGVKDGRWSSAFLMIAEKARAPLLPMHIEARNSLFFYCLSLISKPLSNFWLINETFKHAENSVVIRIGELVDPAGHIDLNLPLKTKARLFRKQVYRLPKDKPSLFKTISPIAHPENGQLLRKEIEQCELLGQTRDQKSIFLYRYTSGSLVIREIGRLREETFRLIGEGTGRRRDIDRYDQHYLHIVLWDRNDLEIVGAYRLCPTSCPSAAAKNKGLYTRTLFDYQPGSEHILSSGLELGRSFVQSRYWGSRSLDYLWQGIAAFLLRHPQYRYLLGAVSISNAFSRPAKDLMVGYYQKYYGAEQSLVACKRPYVLDDKSQARVESLFGELNARDAFIVLKEQLGHLGFSVPALYKQYTELCTPGGALFHGFNIDPDFNDCVDGLVIVDISQLTSTKRRRYGLQQHLISEAASSAGTAVS